MTLRSAKYQLVMTMMATHISTPPRAVNLWKYFQVGLQFGEPSQSSKKQAALIPPYRAKKKIETIGATASKDPIKIAITHRIAFRARG